jgi:hypothetical protein
MYRSFWTYSSSLLLLVILTACGQSAAPAARTAPDVSQDPVTIGGSADASRAPVTIGGSADASQAPVTIGGGNPGTELVPGNPSSHGGAVSNHVSFVDNLRAKGLMVEPASSVEQPFLSAKGELLRLSGGELKQPAEVQSFEYASADAVAAELDQIGPDDKLLVLYVGDDAAVLGILTELLGAQVAGR